MPYLERIKQWCYAHTSTGTYAGAIYVREDKDKMLAQIWRKRLTVIGIFVAVLLVAIVLCITGDTSGDSPLEGSVLTRGQDDTTVDVTVSGEKDGKVWETILSLPLDSREFTEEEQATLDDKVKEYIEKDLPGKNTSLDQVEHKLNLVETMEDTDMEISWTVDDAYLKEDGRIRYKNIPSSGVDTTVMAKASLKNWKQSYHFTVHLLPKDYTEEELWSSEVATTLKKVLKGQADKEQVELPQSIGDVDVDYSTKEDKSFMPVYLVLGVLVLLPFVWREEERKKLREREEELLMDHPSVVNKFMLLLGAGMTVRKIIERLVDEYEQQRIEGGKKRYVYEEMCVMLQEMNDGVSEGDAMEHFGKRCQLLPYLRFSSVITQNLKKGAEGLLKILEAESMEAQKQRKERALQLGEKAGTKLLLPMMLMLGIVMAVIMVPAFMTM